MKYCPNCNAEVEDSFQLCWNCNYSFTEKQVVDIAEPSLQGKRDMRCLRCPDVGMIFSGNYKFHEGTRIGALGSFMEAFTNRESFDLYICPKCGKVEFYSPLR